MTSLAQQLQRLALPQSDPSLLSRDEVASLLFDPKEAATIDRDTAFAIGCTGLEELLGIDPAFEQFEAPLFSQLAKTLARSVQTKAVNKQLDENISLFLIHLSPYFLLKPAHKCLEWLIHRFHIHLYNQDSLIACVLPYHETRIFVRVIQLLKINNPKHKWFWLLPVKQSGVPLAKGTLITHCYKDLGFMDFICSLVTKSVKVFAEYPGSSAQLRVLLTFYASTIVSALVTAENISDNIVAKLFPYVQKGLKSSLPDYRAATYMIICQISVKVTMEDTVVNSLASQIIKTLTKTPSLIKEGLGCLIVLLQRQKPDSLGKKPFPHLCNVPDLITILHGISETYDISPLLRYMLPHLVVSIINHVTGEETEGMDGQIYRKHLEAILTHISLKNNLDHLLASLLFEEYISYNSQEEIDPNKASLLNEQFLPLIRLLESKYPRTLDVVLEEHLKQITDLKKQELFHQFISLSTSGGKYQFLADSNTSLVLSLNHPLAPVRLLAVNHLKNIMKTSKESIDESFIKEAILTRLGDDSIDVVLSAISAFEIFKSHFSPEVTVSNLLNLFQRAELSKNRAWYEVLEVAADILIKEETLSGNDELANQVVVHLLPFMVVDSDDLESAETKLAIYLSKSGICSLHPVLRGWKAALENVIKSTKSGKLIGIANQKMIELLADNINSGDPSSVLKLVEDLISVGEKESFSLKQKVTFHVIMAVLVSCCSSSKGTHFPFAIRVFSLLQKKIKKLESVMTAVEVPPEWHAELVLDRGVPVQLWAHYIQQVRTAQRIAVEDSVLLLFSLKNFIHALKAPKSFPKGGVWWNPDRLEEDGRDYLRLLVGLFEIILSGADSTHFRVLMKLFMKVHLEDVSQLFKFLSVVWTYGSSLSNPLSCRVKTALQTQALYMGCAVLASQKPQSKAQLASMSSPVVASLLLNLGSPIKEVRRAAVHCLQALGGVASQFHLVIEHVTPKAEEVTSDASYVIQDLATLFEELQREKKLKTHQKLSETLKNLLYCVSSCPSYVAKDLLKVLQGVNSEMVLAQLLPMAEQLLEKIHKEPSAVLKDEATVLHLILGKYNEYSASLLHKDPKSLDIFIKAVHTTEELFTGMPSVQITALEKVLYLSETCTPFPVLSVSALQIEVEDECGHRFCCSFAETVPKAPSPPSEAAGEMLQVFNVDAHTGKQLRHLKFLSVSFMGQLLASSHFIRKVVESGGPQALKGLEQSLLEAVLGYINAVAQSVEKNADKLTGKFWRALLSKAYDMLDKVNALLPTETFIPVIRGLLGNPLPSVRRKAMDLLNNKLQQKASWKKKTVYHFLRLVPVLLAIVQRRKKGAEEQAVNRQTALYTLKLLCKNFGAENPEPFIPVLNTAVRLVAPEKKDEKNVVGSALLCVAEAASTLGPLAVPQLPSLMPSLLTTMKNTSELVSGDVYLLSALAALQKVVETLPHFLSPYLEGVLAQVIHLEKITREMGAASQANVRLASLKKTLATTLSPRVLLPAINKTYKHTQKDWRNHMGPFMSILQEHIGVMKKEELTSHQSQLTTFFLEALDFRAQHPENDLEEVGKTENHIIDCLVAMVVKLSEVTFRPLFFKLFDWAKTEDAPKDRLLTFYNLADCIAAKLKGLFTLFAGHLVKPFADTLNQVNISKTDEAFFDSENDPEKCCLLLQFILSCLHKIFLFDTQHFLSKERAEALMMPLVDQLENRLGGEERFQERVTRHLVPCIAQFSVAMADDSLWKPLNYQVLLKTRDSSPKVRFAALITVLALAETLKENYMVLLPESIPFLAELMEDECEEVEHQCQRTVQQLEAVLGEPLQSYF
ncbi:PREDICTED: HEAT repeat-containing protein 1 [Myotis brandtii]|uniref:HEAT repeat-containing protein 1 n=1 Tax=Myotis brandtii TaxID=109478 RepID=UPI000703F698|nr:PREDICTED: HEAT repeat-containing protein 1 [Myotis brandtii]